MQNLVRYENGNLVIAEEAMKKIAEANALMEEVKALDKQIKTEMLDAMELYDIKKIENDYFTATYIEENTRSTVDTKALIRDGLYAKYTKETPVKASVRMKFKVKKDD